MQLFWNSSTLTLPSGYYCDDTHVLSLKIGYDYDTWVFPGPPNVDLNYGYRLAGYTIHITHPDNPWFHDQPIKALVMKMP